MASEQVYPTAALENEAYVEHWSEDAERFEQQGCYAWMAEQLADVLPHKVLDVGCGTGAGVLALRKRFDCRVFSIDSNESCIRQSFDTLRRARGRTTKRLRFEYQPLAVGSHAIHVDQNEIKCSRDSVVLIQGDVLFGDGDVALSRYLEGEAPFDALTVWLIGSYMMRQSCVNHSSLSITTPSEYRLHVQNRAYEIASKLLRTGGALQFVDRCLNADYGAVMLASHHEQAEGTSMEVEKITFQTYRQGGSKGVNVVTVSEDGGVASHAGKLALASVIAKRK